MARITIEDLPPYEELSQAEKEALFGAGPPKFRPQIEALEERLVLWLSAGTRGAYSMTETFRNWSDEQRGFTPAAVNVAPTPQPPGVSYENHLSSTAADEYARLGKGINWDVWQQAWQQEEKKEGHACALDPVHPGDAPDRVTPGQVYAIHPTTPGGPEDAFGDRVLASLSAHTPLTGLRVQQTFWSTTRLVGKPVPTDPVPPGVTLHQMPVVQGDSADDYGVSLDRYVGKQASAQDVGPAVGPTAAFRKALAEVAKTTNLTDRISINAVDKFSFDVTLYRPGVGWVKQGVSMNDRWGKTFMAWSSNDIAPNAKGSCWAMVVERAYLQEMGVDWRNLDAAGWAQKYGASFQSYDNAMTVLTGQAKPGAAAPWVKTNIQDKDLAAIEQALSQHRAVTATTWQSPYQTTGAVINPTQEEEPPGKHVKDLSVVGIIHDGDNVLVRVYDNTVAIRPNNFSWTNRQVEAQEYDYINPDGHFTAIRNPLVDPYRGTITLTWAEFKSFFEKVTVADHSEERMTATLDSSGVLRLDMPPGKSRVVFGGVEHKGRFSLDGVDIHYNGQLVHSVEARLIHRIDIYSPPTTGSHGDFRLDGLTHAIDVNVYVKNALADIPPEQLVYGVQPYNWVCAWKGVQGDFHGLC